MIFKEKKEWNSKVWRASGCQQAVIIEICHILLLNFVLRFRRSQEVHNLIFKKSIIEFKASTKLNQDYDIILSLINCCYKVEYFYFEFNFYTYYFEEWKKNTKEKEMINPMMSANAKTKIYVLWPTLLNQYQSLRQTDIFCNSVLTSVCGLF